MSSAYRLLTLVTFCALFVTHSGLAEAKKLRGDRLLDPDHLLEIQITLDPDDWAELCGQRRNFGTFFSGRSTASPYNYFKADIWIDGVKIESVGVRKKGLFGSVDSRRPSLKVKFDEFVDQKPVKGLSRLTLNNNKQDRSQVSQYLAYKICRDAGIHAPRCSLVRVTANGEYLGVYSNVESIKKPFLSDRFDNKTGNLYEGTLTDFHPKTIEKIEAKTNEKLHDRSDIARLAELIAAEGPLDLSELEEVIDLDYFYRYWAMEALIRFWDGYASNQNNYFIYFNPSNGKGYFIPWGADWTFMDRGPGMFNRRGSTAVYAQSLLANRLYHSSGVPERYRQVMDSLIDKVWKEQDLLDEVDRIEELISPHLHESQSGAPVAMNEVRDFIRSRRESLKAEFEQWPASVPAEPRKPMYTVAVGEARGSFETTWTDLSTEEPPAGKSTIEVKLNDETVTFEQQFVRARTRSFSRFGFGGGTRGGRAGPASEPPVSLVFTGNRAGDQGPLTISLTVDRESFEKTKQPIEVTGRLTEGRQSQSGGFGFGGGPNRTVHGRLRLSDSGTSPGDKVTGTLELKVEEVHGGFFNRRRPPVNRTPPPPLLRTLDADGDGTLSETEIEKATATLKKLDRNNDGELSTQELNPR